MNKVQQWLKDAYEKNRSEVKILLGGIAALIVIVVLSFVCLAGGQFVIEQTNCNASTAEIGFPHRWGLWEGCQIEVTEGQWIPLESYRYTAPVELNVIFLPPTRCVF